MKCPKCHSDNPDTQRFCGECGTQLFAAEEIPVSPTKTLKPPIRRLAIRSIFAGRYEIVEELGKGGMGEVYRVKDKKLNEEMALKVLKPEIAADKGTIERFKNELKFARKIAHRNVCKMYDLNEEEEIPYITMEYVKGEDLKSFIRSKGKLAEEEAISIAKQVCEGLAEAHELGVVHRDLKPQNIMIDEKRQAKIMDFGIARSVEASGVTQTGVMIGTPDYISPEQAEGEEADQRADIYSLGVILYEIVTGRVPFKGETALSVALKHKTQLPLDPRKLNPQVSENLSHLILICMEKDREKRYQTAKELLSELTNIEKGILPKERVVPEKKPSTLREIAERIGKVKWKRAIFYGGAALLLILLIVTAFSLFTGRREAIDSLAVLPLENLSGDSGQEYLVDGMTDALIAKLSQIRGLRVISRTSIMMYKDARKPLPEIARELNVNVIVEGAVVRVGERVRITAKLIEAATERNLWARDYERNFGDVLALQKEVAQAIANEIKVTLTPKEEARLASAQEVNPEAYEAYLKGEYFRRKVTAEGFKKAMEYFQKAIEIDPTYALAHAGMAETYSVQPSWGLLLPKDGYPMAEAAAKKALELDGTLAEAYSALGAVKLCYDLDWAGAERELKHALELNPGYMEAHGRYARYLSAVGRHKEAIAESKRAVKLDPISTGINSNLGIIFYFARQYDKAIEQLQKTIELDPTFLMAQIYLSSAYLQKSMFEEAMAAWQKAGPYAGLGTVLTHAMAGRKEEARRMVGELTREWGTRNPTFIVSAYASLGEKDKAFEWLQKSYNKRDFFLHQLKVEPLYDPLRSDPRFQDLMYRMNFPQ